MRREFSPLASLFGAVTLLLTLSPGGAPPLVIQDQPPASVTTRVDSDRAQVTPALKASSV